MNKILKIIVSILFIFLIIITIYKFGCVQNNHIEHYFEHTEIINHKTDDETEIKDSEVYKQSIITENLLSTDYNFYDDSESIAGKIYIDNDKYLYITDSNKNIQYRVSDVKFETIYFKKLGVSNYTYIYLLSSDNKVYLLSVENNNIYDVNIQNYRYAEKFVNFVDIDIKHDKYQPANTVFALTEEGKIYNINAGLRYDERIVSLYNKIYVYHDNTMTSIIGNLIENRSGERYKIKYIFWINNANGFIDDNLPIIITEDNKFIYLNQDTTYVYEFDKKVKEITFDQYRPYIRGNISITFEDDYSVKFEGSCNQYYCINEFSD